MGIVKEFKCPSCRKVWKISTGHGIAHSSFRNVLKAFPSDVKAKILAEAKDDPEPLFLFNYRAAVCHQCQSIVSVPVFHFLDTGKSYKLECPVCGGQAEIFEDDSGVTCPFCQEDTLCKREIGHWD